MLTLPIKRKWYDMIVRGKKLEEYRNPEYWLPRIIRERDRQFGLGRVGFAGMKVRIRAGYKKDAPLAELTLKNVFHCEGKSEWGAEPGVEYLVLRIAKVEEIVPPVACMVPRRVVHTGVGKRMC